MIKCYHFCSSDFYKKLLKENIIYADSDLRLNDGEPASYVKKYAFITEQLNKGRGMFFAWSNPCYKGEIEFDNNGSYILLELSMKNEDIAILTNYENWCSLGVDIHLCDGDLKLADEYCREEYHMKNGLKDSYNAIFDVSNSLDEIQVLLPFIKKNWIKSARRCGNKNI